MKRWFEKIKEKDLFVVTETLIFGIVIFVAGVHSINNLYGMITGVDEFGYVCNAKYLLNDKEWKDLSSKLSYYSFGYSLILMPLVKIIKDPSILFRGIVIMNVCLVELSFFTSIKVISGMHKSVSKRKIVFVCFIANMYIANFVYSKYIFAEMLIVLLFWISLLILQRICNRYDWKKVQLLALVSSYIFFVHQRTLGVVCAFGIVLVALFLKKKMPVMGILSYLLTMAIMFVIGLCIKKMIINNVYLNNENIAINDFSGQMSRLKYVFQVDNLNNLVFGFLSKLYYFLLATASLGGLGIISFAKKACLIKNSKKENDESYIGMFIVTVFLLSMGIQTYFLISPNRYDLVIYGRYVEFMYGVLIAEGMVVIIDNKTRIHKVLLGLFIISVAGGYSAILLFEKFNLQICTSYLAPALFLFFNGKYPLKESVYLSLIFIVALCTLFWIVCKGIRKNKIVVIGVMLLCFWGESYRLLDDAILEDQKLLKTEYVSLAGLISDYTNEIGILYEEGMGVDRMQQLQFLCPLKEFHFVMIDNIELFGDYLVLAERSTAFESELRNSGREILYQNYRYNLWSEQHER